MAESDLKGSFVESRRTWQWGFQSKDEAFAVLHGQRTMATGGGTMPKEVSGGWKVETKDSSYGVLRKPPELERQAFSDGRGDMLERITEEELKARSRETGWLFSLKNLVVGGFSRGHRASERVKEPLAIEQPGEEVVEPVGGADKEAAGRFVPEWVRPSRRELEDIVHAQVNDCIRRRRRRSMYL